MTNVEPAGSRPFTRVAPLVGAAIVAMTGSSAVAADTCSWTRTPSGADVGSCVDSGHKAYCVTCQFAPRVCVRTPC